MIIETSDNRYYLVHETGNPDLAHVWVGTEVRFNKKKSRWEKRANRSGGRPPALIRKAATRIVAGSVGKLDAT